MERDKLFFRCVLLHYFDLKKSAAETHRLLAEIYGESAPSETVCRDWFRRFKSGDCDVHDKQRTGQSKKFEDEQLQALLEENPAQTLKELSQQLKVDKSTIFRRLQAMGKIQKEGKWQPHELTENAIANRLNISISLLAKHNKKSFLWRIVTGDEKWIFFNNPKRKESWVDPGQPSISTPKRNIHGHKAMLCIWWDMEGVVYYELLKPNETITTERYQQQLERLNDNLMQKRPSIASNRRKVILLHDNARSHVAIAVKQTLIDLEWEVLPHPAYSPDLAPSDYHLFRSMQHALEDTHFHNYSEVENWVAEWIDSKDRPFFRRGIQLLPEKWQKVIASEGKYFD